MKVLVISPMPPFELPDAEHGYRIASHLAERGVDVHVLSQQGTQIPEQANLHVHPVMHRWDWSEMPRLLRCVRDCAPDAILLNYVGHMYDKRPMITFAPTLSKMVRPRVRFVTQFEQPQGAFNGMSPSLLPRLSHRIIRSLFGKNVDWEFGTLLRDSDKVIVLSELHLPRLKEAYSPVDGKSVLVPPAVLLRVVGEDEGRVRQAQRQALSVQPNETVLAYLGYIYEKKGVETLLAAFEQVCRHRDDVRLVIVGGVVRSASTPLPEYAQRIYDLAENPVIKDKVHFSGGFDTDSDQPSRYLRAADIAVLPFDLGVRLNNSSVAGVVSHGLPLITTEGDLLEASFLDGQNVLLCPPKDPHQMAEAIERVVDDVGLRATLRHGAEQIADQWFSWDGTTERILGALQPSDSLNPHQSEAVRTAA